MIRIWACDVCHHLYEVGGSDEEIQYLLRQETSYPCITPLCRGRLRIVPGGGSEWAKVSSYLLEEVTLRSFFRAVMGFGKFDGAPAQCQQVKDLLLRRKIVDVQAEPVGNPERTILHQVVLDDGTRLHFATSSHGACCYYVEGASPSCVEVFDREQSNVVCPEADPEVSNPNREEVGRGSERLVLPGDQINRYGQG